MLRFPVPSPAVLTQVHVLYILVLLHPRATCLSPQPRTCTLNFLHCMQAARETGEEALQDAETAEQAELKAQADVQVVGSKAQPSVGCCCDSAILLAVPMAPPSLLCADGDGAILRV